MARTHTGIRAGCKNMNDKNGSAEPDNKSSTVYHIVRLPGGGFRLMKKRDSKKQKTLSKSKLESNIHAALPDLLNRSEKIHVTRSQPPTIPNLIRSKAGGTGNHWDYDIEIFMLNPATSGKKLIGHAGCQPEKQT